MMYVTRRECFNAAHRVYNPKWSDKKNNEVFGACANPNWHGHNYELFVTVKGNMNKDTGFVVDLRALSILIKKQIIDKVDHKNFNMDVPFLKGQMSSTENIIVAFWEQLEKPIAKLGCKLHSLKLQETENNVAEYFGGK
ncbi:MAG TPA: 6-carboxytetrahydropterin synthase [Bacteroidia bacterium]|jgi:6-pyruvoyltetrahydropterin/6-carboxytetrahydropterin synthase|nr:6-carboxytetrahydropterin synthase [Bacteroidia bacterium]